MTPFLIYSGFKIMTGLFTSFFRIVFFGCVIVLFSVSGSLYRPAQAHEIRPALLEFTVSDEQPRQLALHLGMTAEIFLAELDVTGLADTDDSKAAADYDRLRAQSPEWLSAELRRRWTDLAGEIRIEYDGQPLSLGLDRIEVETGLSLTQIRQTDIYFTAALPHTQAPLVISWSSWLGPLVVRQMPADNPSGQETDSLYAGFLQSGQTSGPIELASAGPQPVVDVAVHYTVSGIYHIIPLGLDHILFVLGLFLFSLSGRVLVIQISLFTFAHTITLALASLGIVRVAPEIVEPLIALSIVYVAAECLWTRGKLTWLRGGLIFSFGLLHGLGFASVLADVGLPASSFLAALVSFNIGVELGQLAIVAPLFLLVSLWRPRPRLYRGWVQLPVSLAIAFVGLYWAAERTGLIAV